MANHPHYRAGKAVQASLGLRLGNTKKRPVYLVSLKDFIDQPASSLVAQRRMKTLNNILLFGWILVGTASGPWAVGCPAQVFADSAAPRTERSPLWERFASAAKHDQQHALSFEKNYGPAEKRSVRASISERTYWRLMGLYGRNMGFFEAVHRGADLRRSDRLGQVTNEINHMASHVATELRDLALNLVERDLLAEADLLFAFADRFDRVKEDAPKSYVNNRPLSRATNTDYGAVKGHGKLIDSLWSELRVALLVPDLIGTSIIGDSLAGRGLIAAEDVPAMLERLPKLRDRELDILSGTDAHYVLSEVKVNERAFDRSSHKDTWRKVNDQLRVYMITAAYTRRPTSVQFVFVGGITAEAEADIHAKAVEINKEITDELGLEPVPLYVVGGSHRRLLTPQSPFR